MMGIEIVLDPITKVPGDAIGTAISARCMETGLSCNVVQLKGMGVSPNVATPSALGSQAQGTFRIAPPLTVSEDELREGIQIMDDAFAYVLGKEAEAAKAGEVDGQAQVEGQKANP